MSDGLEPLGAAVALLEREVLPAYLPRQRWFADKDLALREVRLLDAAALGECDGGRGGHAFLAVFALPERDRHYFVPLTVGDGGERAGALAELPHAAGGSCAGIHDGFATDALVLGILADVRAERRRPAARGGAFAAHATAALHALVPASAPRVRRMTVEQSNTSVVIDETIVLKGYRRTHAGPQPELEIARFLAAVGYVNTPALLGFVEYERPGAQPMAVCILQRFIAARGDGWSTTLAYLERSLERPDAGRQAAFDAWAHHLGVRSAELHRAFATPGSDPAFAPEPTTRADLDEWAARARATAQGALDALAGAPERVPEGQRAAAAALLARRAEILERLAAPPLDPGVVKTRYHGDYHLGQVLVVGDDVMIVDFEGEPGRAAAQRRHKSSPLRDLAGMLRSFDYAALSAVHGRPALVPRARAWQRRTSAAFLAGYRAEVAGCSSYPAHPAQAQALLDLFELEKACYELAYELANRPAWLHLPLAGIQAILERGREGGIRSDRSNDGSWP